MSHSPIPPFSILLLTLLACGSDGGDTNTLPDASNALVDASNALADAPTSECPLTTIMLDFEGGDYAGGLQDDSSANETTVIAENEVVSMNAFDDSVMNTTKSRSEIIQDIRTSLSSALSLYAVEVVTQRPATGDYELIAIGGTAFPLGLSSSTASVAALDCADAQAGNVGFVLSDAFALLDPVGELDYTEQIEILVHLSEAVLGMGAGLSFVSECGDVMTFDSACTSTSFQNQTMACGTTSAEDCLCGGTSQNSHQVMESSLGAACR